MQSVFLVAAVMGAVEFIKAINARDYQTAEIIFVAAVIGFVTGMFGVDGLNVVTGIYAGLAAAGAYKAVKIVGNN